MHLYIHFCLHMFYLFIYLKELAFMSIEAAFFVLFVLVTQSSLTLCDSMVYSPPGSSISRILQAGILEWVAISFSRRSS